MGKGEDKHQRDRRRATPAELARKAAQRQRSKSLQRARANVVQTSENKFF